MSDSDNDDRPRATKSVKKRIISHNSSDDDDDDGAGDDGEDERTGPLKRATKAGPPLRASDDDDDDDDEDEDEDEKGSGSEDEEEEEDEGVSAEWWHSSGSDYWNSSIVPLLVGCVGDGAAWSG